MSADGLTATPPAELLKRLETIVRSKSRDPLGEQVRVKLVGSPIGAWVWYRPAGHRLPTGFDLRSKDSELADDADQWLAENPDAGFFNIPEAGIPTLLAARSNQPIRVHAGGTIELKTPVRAPRITTLSPTPA